MEGTTDGGRIGALIRWEQRRAPPVNHSPSCRDRLLPREIRSIRRRVSPQASCTLFDDLCKHDGGCLREHLLTLEGQKKGEESNDTAERNEAQYPRHLGG